MISEQLSFSLPPNVSLGPEDYFVSSANALAYHLVTMHQDWPDGRLMIVGPAASGKSHLIRVWQAMTQGEIISATALPDGMPPGTTDIAVEDIHTLPKDREAALFHLHNNLAAAGRKLLLSSQPPPAELQVALPDLHTRLKAMPLATIPAPDDDLLCAVLAKHFSDRQLFPDADVLAYVAQRIERSFAAAARIVERMDARALSEKRRITKSIARAALADMT